MLRRTVLRRTPVPLLAPSPCWILPTKIAVITRTKTLLRFVSAPHDVCQRRARPPAAAIQHADARRGGELEGALNNALTQQGPARLLSGLPPGMAATGAGPGADARARGE